MAGGGGLPVFLDRCTGLDCLIYLNLQRHENSNLRAPIICASRYCIIWFFVGVGYTRMWLTVLHIFERLMATVLVVATFNGILPC